MGILLCEQNFRDVWRRNKSVGQKFVQFCAHTHKHTHAAKLVVRICNCHANIDPTIFIKIMTSIITRWHDFTLVKGRVGWILESMLNSRGP